MKLLLLSALGLVATAVPAETAWSTGAPTATPVGQVAECKLCKVVQQLMEDPDGTEALYWVWTCDSAGSEGWLNCTEGLGSFVKIDGIWYWSQSCWTSGMDEACTGGHGALTASAISASGRASVGNIAEVGSSDGQDVRGCRGHIIDRSYSDETSFGIRRATRELRL